MSVLGLITARGGSRGVPRKNLAPLGGRPLLSYTCDAALGSQRLDRVVLSTDDEEIAGVGRSLGVEVPFRRPAALASDEATSLSVVQHACRWLGEHERWAPDVVVVLQPTSPLRRAAHIDAALDLLEREAADTVVSVIPLPHRFHPRSVMELRGGRLRFSQEEPAPLRRQELPALYARNGPAVLATRTEVVDAGSLYGNRIVPLVMTEEESIDIDTEHDLVLADLLLRRRAEAVHR